MERLEDDFPFGFQIPCGSRKLTGLFLLLFRAVQGCSMELAGQQRIHLPLEPHLRCSPRVDQLARPADLKPPEDITQRTDFAGLFHVA